MPKKLTYDFVKSQFEKDGYQLLSKDYINNSSKLDYICSENHQHNITWSNWASDYRCPSCAGNAKLTLDFIKTEFSKEGYKLLSKEYINNSSKLNFICPEGHNYFISFGSWATGRRCYKCFGTTKPSITKIKKSFLKDGYKLLSNTYENTHSKLDYICPNDHKHSISWANWESGGYRCPKCSNNVSKFEKEVKSFINNLGYNIIENDRTLIKNPKTNYSLELDILFPCKTKAIECNGVYWHDRFEAKVNDKIKQEQCQKLGIKLLTITDKIWYNDREKCEKIIKDFIDRS